LVVPSPSWPALLRPGARHHCERQTIILPRRELQIREQCLGNDHPQGRRVAICERRRGPELTVAVVAPGPTQSAWPPPPKLQAVPVTSLAASGRGNFLADDALGTACMMPWRCRLATSCRRQIIPPPAMSWRGTECGIFMALLGTTKHGLG
jgi:hypothetical protein